MDVTEIIQANRAVSDNNHLGTVVEVRLESLKTAIEVALQREIELNNRLLVRISDLKDDTFRKVVELRDSGMGASAAEWARHAQAIESILVEELSRYGNSSTGNVSKSSVV